MNISDLMLFAEVARSGSFATAARARDIDPSSVSRTIAGLEATLGVRLFQRTTRRMSLTEEGELYLARAVPLIEELATVHTEALQGRTTSAGSLRLTASVTFGQQAIMPLLPGFRRAFPDITLECVFTDANVDLVAERIDLAVRLAPAIEGDVIATKLMETHYRVVASPDHLKIHDHPKTPKDLSDRDCIRFTLRDWRSEWQFRDADGAVEAVPVNGPLILSPAAALRDAALTGMGPALLADWLVDKDIQEGRLIDLFPDFDATATTFDTAAWIIYPSRAYLPAKTRVMIDFLKRQFRARSRSKNS